MNSKSCLLFIEDYPAVQQMYVEVMREEGFDVTISSNGKDALKKAEGRHYDGIIVDLLLPDMNGVEFIKAFKAVHQPDKTKIIVLTNFDDPAFVKKVHELGIKNYWMKVDTNPHELADKIKKTLQ